jgi:hypothetical protein
VELDPTVGRVAEEYFGYHTGQGLTIDDGRRFLARTDHIYDAIVIDAYTSEALPSHLLSREAFVLMRQRLSPAGVVVLNMIELDRAASPARLAVARTQREVFPYGVVYTVDPAGRLRGQILVAAQQPPETPPVPVEVTMPPGPPFEGRRIGAHPGPFETNGGALLTDAYNPLEQLNLSAAEMLRQTHRDYFQWRWRKG